MCTWQDRWCAPRYQPPGVATRSTTTSPAPPPEDLVSLTMPRALGKLHVAPRLAGPFFLMNLPGRFQKDLVRAKLVSWAKSRDPGLLALTGNRTIGRGARAPPMSA